MSSSIFQVSMAALWGLVAGAIFFAGLWFSVRRITEAKHRAWILLGSFLVRAAVVLGLAWASVETAGSAGILAYLLGLTTVRFVSIGMARKGGFSGRERADNA